jgi:DivIVA domain-containing protein
MNPDELASRSFAVVRRGFDTAEVRTLLAQIAQELRVLQRRESELERRLAEPAPPPATPEPIDEETLVGAVGIETARILQAAHDAAREIVTRAERRATALVTDAEGAFAERRRLAEAEAAELRAHVRDEVATLQRQARDECREMVDEAREARRRILSDLAERRRALHLQLEQMRAGKDALAGIIESVSYSVVSSVEEVRARLEGSEEAARIAAATATIDPLVEEELALDAVELAALGTGFTLGDPGAASERTTADAPSAGADAVPSPPVTMSPAVSVAASRSVDASDAVGTEDGIDAAASVGSTDPAISPSSDIDELFARIRSARAGEATMERTVVDTPVEPDPEPEHEGDGASGEESDEFTLLVRRDQLLGPAIAELSRSLKRALRLEENELRDTARHLPKDPDALAELVQPATITRIVDASERSLAQAQLAGASFVAELLGLDAIDIPADEQREIAARLAQEIVDPLRERIEAAVREAEGEGDPSIAVGVAFRDWRGPRIEGVAGNFATWAFSAGVISAAAARAARLHWIVDDGDSNCPDCEDNALAGDVMAGEEFPTGHGHPPIHPGCRCLLVPSPAN